MDNLKDILLDGEEVLWSGAPQRLPVGFLVWLAFFTVLFSGFFIAPLGYALLTGDGSVFDSYNFSVNGQRITSETPSAFLRAPFVTMLVMMFVFVAFGLGWLLSKMREIYGITNKRIVILSRFPQRRIASLNPTQLRVIERRGGEKIGTISFVGSKHGLVDKVLALYRIRLHSFTNIENPKSVEALIFERFELMLQKEISQ